MSTDGPPLIRPIPRRPFDLNISSPTPPDGDSRPPSPSAADIQTLRGMLDPNADQGNTASTSISRAQSILNLTGSTLFGIYSPSAANQSFDQDEPGTPWGTGAETPARSPAVDEPTFELMRRRSEPLRHKGKVSRRTSGQGPGRGILRRRPSRAARVFALVMRASLLFGLGVGYGVLVSQLHGGHLQQQHLAAHGLGVEAESRFGQLDWRYLAFWGVFGVSLGTLLPWFDGVWEDMFGCDEVDEGDGKEGGGSSPDTDWALVIRGVGAFVGIVFAIRKLPWTSTMQASLTLALVNPFLWYLIDRSKPGFLLSSAVGTAGTALLLLLGLGPEMVPSSMGHGHDQFHEHKANSTASQRHSGAAGLAAHQETIETGVWMLSVLFCSCVCFGNIGRRLALSKSASTRGRWGDSR